jgi:hypothetical protein
LTRAEAILAEKFHTRVRVTERLIGVEPTGEQKGHPHAGKTGTITELLGVRLTGIGWMPRAMVRLDGEAGAIAIVTLQYLDLVPDVANQ